MRLEIALVHPVRPELAFDDHVGASQRRRGVAVAIALARDHVGRQGLVVEVSPGTTHGRMDRSGVIDVRVGGHERPKTGERRIGRHGRIHVDDRGQRLRVHDHELDGVLRRGLGLGHDQRHRLAREQDLIRGQRLEHPHVVAMADGQVGRGQDGDHARDGQGGARIDAPDPGVRIDAGHDPRPQQTGRRPVAPEAGHAGDLGPRVQARAGRADEPVPVGLRRHRTSRVRATGVDAALQYDCRNARLPQRRITRRRR